MPAVSVRRSVARRAGDLRHDGAVIAEQRVQQRALARVGPPDDHGRDAAAQQPPALKGPAQGAQRAQRGLERAAIGLEPEVLDVLVGVVEHGVVVGADVGEGGGDRLDPPGDGAGELARCVARGFHGLGVDQVGHRLGRAEVHPAV